MITTLKFDTLKNARATALRFHATSTREGREVTFSGPASARLASGRRFQQETEGVVLAVSV